MTLLLLLLLPSLGLSSECPKLAGEFTCVSPTDDSPRPLRITQWDEGGVEVYNDQSDDYYTDGSPHALDWGFFRGGYTASCAAGRLRIELAGEVFVEGEKLADITNTSHYTRQDENTLRFHERYVRRFPSGEVEEIVDDYTCTLDQLLQRPR